MSFSRTFSANTALRGIFLAVSVHRSFLGGRFAAERRYRLVGMCDPLICKSEMIIIIEWKFRLNKQFRISELLRKMNVVMCLPDVCRRLPRQLGRGPHLRPRFGSKSTFSYATHNFHSHHSCKYELD